MITTRILCDSLNPAGDRITTGLWTYPRYIHSEILTHRMLAKNSASSRAIPVEKMIQAVRENPAMFEQYGAANKGMQAQELMNRNDQGEFERAWLDARNYCLRAASDVREIAAKQLVNRMLEPWMHMTIIITGTDWQNFFALRAHPAAQPEFQVLAYRWLDAYLKSEPVQKGWGEWHLPLVTENTYRTVVYGENPEGRDEGTFDLTLEQKQKMSVARCARVSYTKHDQATTLQSDEGLHDRLLASGHMSPFEHQAMATCGEVCFDPGRIDRTPYFGCFKGWLPYRKMLPNENRTNVDLAALLAAKPDWITL